MKRKRSSKIDFDRSQIESRSSPTRKFPTGASVLHPIPLELLTKNRPGDRTSRIRVKFFEEKFDEKNRTFSSFRRVRRKVNRSTVHLERRNPNRSRSVSWLRNERFFLFVFRIFSVRRRFKSMVPIFRGNERKNFRFVRFSFQRKKNQIQKNVFSSGRFVSKNSRFFVDATLRNEQLTHAKKCWKNSFGIHSNEIRKSFTKMWRRFFCRKKETNFSTLKKNEENRTNLNDNEELS